MVEGLNETVESLFLEAVGLRRKLGAWVSYAINLSDVATIHVWREGNLSQASPMQAEALAIAEDQRVPYVTAHVLAGITTIRLIKGRYQEALGLAEKVLAMLPQDLNKGALTSFQRGIAYLGLGRMAEASQTLKAPLAQMIKEDWSGMLRNLIAFTAVILTERGQETWAAELLAHGLTHPITPGRLEVDPLITRYRQKLEASLGEEAFAAAWERGQGLDTLEVSAEVLAELNRMEPVEKG